MRRFSDIMPNIMEMCPYGVLLLDENDFILECNHAALEMFEYTKDAILKLRLQDLLLSPAANEQEQEYPKIFCKRKGGSSFPAHITNQGFSHQQKTYKVCFVRDISEEVSIWEQLTYMARYDTLTGLPNRSFILKKLQNLKKPVIVGMLDLDNFKMINDTYGHPVGDSILFTFGQLLLNMAPQLQAGRFGGEEFLIMFSEGSLSAAREKMQQVLFQAKKTCQEYGGISFSCGLCVYDPAMIGVDTAISKADALLYYAKQSGRGRIITPEDVAKRDLIYP